MRGTYRDVVRDPFGWTLADSGWRSNTIVLAAWPLMAGLLKNDPSLRGILFWAVGAGLSAWDAMRPAADTAATQLAEELDRMPVAPETIAYIGADALIAESGAAADAVLRLQEQAGALQMTLDNRYLRQVTVGQMAQRG